MDVVLGVAGGIVVVGGALAVLAKGARGLANGIRRLVRMADEVLGDGTDERPGWGRRLERIEGELTLNGGQSLKDMVVRMDRRLERVEDAVAAAPVFLRPSSPNSRG
ncbi:MAG: hypothetical protein IRY85_14910 [Micromonosporaceae bacterium]|nr:hypothetical protein [Micromonosporaceae bacterium]